jgi:1-acyl-sn-glycerol-3-phosphate acyltransferase
VGLEKDEFMTWLEGACEKRSNELIAMATGEPVKPAKLVTWDDKKRADIPT